MSFYFRGRFEETVQRQEPQWTESLCCLDQGSIILLLEDLSFQRIAEIALCFHCETLDLHASRFHSKVESRDCFHRYLYL